MENTENKGPSTGSSQGTEQVKQQVTEAMHGLEAWLAPMYQNAPHIPENGRKVIVQIAPWAALVFGILGIVGLFTALAGGLFLTIGTLGFATPYLLRALIPLAFSAVSVALMLIAFPGLQAMKKSAWNLMFYATTVNVLGGVASVFGAYGYMMSGFAGTIIGAIIGYWLLFEIRSYYK